MFDSSGRKIFIGLVTGVLLSSAIAPVLAEDKDKSYYLIDSEGKAVKTVLEKQCVITPVTPNDPTRRFEECGDISDRDGDGITDDKDKCPDNTPEEISKGVYGDKNHPDVPPDKMDRIGCPIDTDGDTVEDYRDNCPNTEQKLVMEDRKRGLGSCIHLDSKSGTKLGCDIDKNGNGIADCLETAAPTIEGGCHQVLAGDVTFGYNKADLTPQGKAALDALARSLTPHLGTLRTVVISGHTDSIGSDKYNQGLSERRAQSVVTYLISKGLPANRIVAKGEGKRRPIADNRTEVGRAKNRRVEVDIDDPQACAQPAAKPVTPPVVGNERPVTPAKKGKKPAKGKAKKAPAKGKVRVAPAKKAPAKAKKAAPAKKAPAKAKKKK